MILRFDKIGAIVEGDTDDWVINRNKLISIDPRYPNLEISAYLYKIIIDIKGEPTMFVFSHYTNVQPITTEPVTINRMLLDAIHSVTSTTQLYYVSENVDVNIGDMMYDHNFMFNLIRSISGYPPFTLQNDIVIWDSYCDSPVPINEPDNITFHISEALYEFYTTLCGVISTNMVFQCTNVLLYDVRYFERLHSSFPNSHFLLDCFENLDDILYVSKSYDDILTLVYRNEYCEIVTLSWSIIGTMRGIAI